MRGRTEESLEYLRPFRLVYSWPVVLNGEFKPVLIGADRYPYIAFALGIKNRILHQVAHHLGEQGKLAGNVAAVGSRDMEANLFLVCERT